jgi:TPR repeat protein
MGKRRILFLLANFCCCSKQQEQVQSQVQHSPTVTRELGGASGESKSMSPKDFFRAGLELSDFGRSLEERRRSLRFLETACNEGIADSCQRLGIILSVDRDLLDPAGATSAYQHGCELGDTKSCSYAGNAVLHSRYRDAGVAQGCRRAAGFFEQACLGGRGMDCGQLGDLYARGCDDFPRDRVKAKKYQRLRREWLRDNAP